MAGVTWWRWLALALAVALLVVALIRPGSSSATVATVDGHAISETTYGQWLKIAAASAHASEKELPAFVPDAPGYRRCISFERSALKTSGAAAPSTTQLRSDCVAIRASLAEQVMEFLLGGQWFLDEGAREGINVSAAQVQKALHTTFTKTTGLNEFLDDSHMTRQDLEFQSRVALTTQRLSVRHGGKTPTITAAQIAADYAQSRSALGKETLAQATPAIRDALIAQAQAPSIEAWEAKVRSYFRPRTTCAPGYRLAYYCGAS